MNTLKGASTFRVFIRKLFVCASIQKTFSVSCNIASPASFEKFVKVCNCVNNLWLELQSAIRDAKKLCNGEDRV